MSRRSLAPRGRSPRRDQRGQALVEFAFFFLILVTLLAGVVDIGTLLNDHMDVVYAARQGARTGSVLGPSTPDDCPILAAVQSALLNQPYLTPTKIIVYQADASGNTTGLEDDYSAPFNCASPSTNTWPPSIRQNALFHEDSLGVEIDYTFQFQFNWFGTGPFTGSDRAVFPIGPPS